MVSPYLLLAHARYKALNVPLKYVVGIAIAKDSFVACLGYLEISQQLHFGKEATFDNTASGFADLLRWVAKHQAANSPR